MNNYFVRICLKKFCEFQPCYLTPFENVSDIGHKMYKNITQLVIFLTQYQSSRGILKFQIKLKKNVRAIATAYRKEFYGTMKCFFFKKMSFKACSHLP